jgi:hypothetical protein
VRIGPPLLAGLAPLRLHWIVQSTTAWQWPRLMSSCACSPPMQDAQSASGRGDADLLCFHAEDRIPQIGPIASFALGAQATVGVAKGSKNPILRGAPQLLACTGQGQTGALAVIRGGIVPQQDSAVDFTPLGRCTGAPRSARHRGRRHALVWLRTRQLTLQILQRASLHIVLRKSRRPRHCGDDEVIARDCTGIWGLEHGPDAAAELPDHEYMIISFEKGRESSTFVYKFQAGGPPVAVSDLDACEFETGAATVHACSMFDRQGIVQARLRVSAQCACNCHVARDAL